MPVLPQFLRIPTNPPLPPRFYSSWTIYIKILSSIVMSRSRKVTCVPWCSKKTFLDLWHSFMLSPYICTTPKGNPPFIPKDTIDNLWKTHSPKIKKTLFSFFPYSLCAEIHTLCHCGLPRFVFCHFGFTNYPQNF